MGGLASVQLRTNAHQYKINLLPYFDSYKFGLTFNLFLSVRPKESYTLFICIMAAKFIPQAASIQNDNLINRIMVNIN